VSGAGDGPRKQGLTGANTWSNWSFEDSVVVTATLVAPASASKVLDLFKVTGIVLVHRIYGHVTTAIGAGVTDAQLVFESDGVSVGVTKNGGVFSSLPVGSLVAKTSKAADTIETQSSAAAAIMDEIDAKKESFRLIQKVTAGVGQTSTIQMLAACAAAPDPPVGAIHWHVEYEQISEGSFIEVA